MGYKLNFKLGSEPDDLFITKYPENHLIALLINRFSVLEFVGFLKICIYNVSKVSHMKKYAQVLGDYIFILDFLIRIFSGKENIGDFQIDEAKIKFISLPCVNDLDLVTKFNNLSIEKVSQTMSYTFSRYSTSAMLAKLAMIMLEEIKYAENDYCAEMYIVAIYIEEKVMPLMQKVYDDVK